MLNTSKPEDKQNEPKEHVNRKMEDQSHNYVVTGENKNHEKARLTCKVMWAVLWCDCEEFKNSEHFIFNVYASDRLSIYKHWSHILLILCGNPFNRQILFVEVTTSPFASVGQGLTSCDDLLRMCHCHCHKNVGHAK